MSLITLLTGEIQSGKTSLCLEVVAAARSAGVQLGGLISPGVFEDGEKIAIDVLDVRSGERTRLAEGPGGNLTDLTTRRWAFQSQAVAWGNRVLKNAVPCELLVIDELGPLEFLRGEGWLNGFQAVASGDYTAALLVIRPSLLEEALKRWEIGEIIDLNDPQKKRQSGEEVLELLLQNRS